MFKTISDVPNDCKGCPHNLVCDQRELAECIDRGCRVFRIVDNEQDKQSVLDMFGVDYDGDVGLLVIQYQFDSDNNAVDIARAWYSHYSVAWSYAKLYPLANIY